jgi:multidrug efflux pump subunit AcrA (membrane-fusion protein)
VRVLLPGGATVAGHVSEVGTVAAASESPSGEKGGGSSEATITVTVTLDHPAAHLDQAPVSVELVKSIRRNVLTVPATALIATAGGGYAVEALADGRRVPVAVTPGMFSSGYVQVEGPGVRDGMTVIESE